MVVMFRMSEAEDLSVGALAVTDTAAPFGFTFGASHTQSTWSDFRRVTWPQLVKMMTSHVPGQKEGSCIVPAQFRGNARKKEDAARIDVAFLDSDSGATLAEIVANVKIMGWEAVISSTHSHMSTRTRVSLSNWDRFFEKKPDATAAQFLVQEKGYLPRVAVDARPGGVSADYVIVEHQPCPKFRVVIPLETPWLAAAYPSQAAANDAWKERIEALSSALKLDHDQACTDTSRLFYLPRRPANGVVPETAVVTGIHCDIFSLPSVASEPLNLFSPQRTRPAQSEGRPEYIDPIAGEVIDLAAWAKDYGNGFLIAKLIRERKGSKLTGRVTDSKVHIDCPNAGAHTDPTRDGATYVVNGGQSATKGFVIHCRHGHCTGKDRLFFLKAMLEDGWFRSDDLTDPQFQAKQEAKPDSLKDQAPHGLPMLWFNEIEEVLDAKDFVQGVLLEEGAAVVYGESNAGKTFWTTDLSLHVAAGIDWCGRRVEQGGVVYCVLEGGIGFKNRVAAWRKEHKFEGDDIPFVAIPSMLNLLDPNADTGRLISAIIGAIKRMGMSVKLVVIDTLSRAMAGGNENAPDDMGALVKNMDRIRQETGACVLFVHHSGKDQAKGARGHSLLRAAVDTEIEVVADELGESKTATVVKQRELPKGVVIPFVLKVVDLGQNRHAEPVTTCIVEFSGEGHAPGGASGRPRLKGDNKRALEVLADLVATEGKSGASGIPAGLPSVPEKWWRERFYDRAKAGAEPEAKQRAFRRAADFLVEKHFVGMLAGRVWVANGPKETGQNTGQESGQYED